VDLGHPQSNSETVQQSLGSHVLTLQPKYQTSTHLKVCVILRDDKSVLEAQRNLFLCSDLVKRQKRKTAVMLHRDSESSHGRTTASQGGDRSRRDNSGSAPLLQPEDAARGKRSAGHRGEED